MDFLQLIRWAKVPGITGIHFCKGSVTKTRTSSKGDGEANHIEVATAHTKIRARAILVNL